MIDDGLNSLVLEALEQASQPGVADEFLRSSGLIPEDSATLSPIRQAGLSYPTGSIPIPAADASRIAANAAIHTHSHYYDTETHRKRLAFGDNILDQKRPPPARFIVPNHLSATNFDAIRSRDSPPSAPLPWEILSKIFSQLRAVDLRSCALVCSSWYMGTRTAREDFVRRYPATHSVHLNKQQLAAYRYVTAERESACILGEAGSGKSCLLRAVDARFRNMGLRSYVVAPTGVAARHIDGMTIHEFLGQNIVPKNEYELRHLAQLGINGNLQPEHPGAARCRAADVLVLDEVSMVSQDLWNYLDLAMRCYRSREEPFGGVQIICFGDFGQLPPVVKGSKKKAYCFETPLFERVFGNPYDPKNQQMIYLCTPMRHARDSNFLAVLQAFRGDNPGQQHKAALMERTERSIRDRGEVFGPGVLAVSHRETKDERNNTALSKITAHPAVTYSCIVTLHLHQPNQDEDSFIRQFISDRGDNVDPVQLKCSARVFYLVNVSAHGLFNKMTGTIREMIDLDDPEDAQELRTRLTDIGKSKLRQSNPEALFALAGDNSVSLCWDERRMTSASSSGWSFVDGIFTTADYPTSSPCNRIDTRIYGRTQHRLVPVVEFDMQPNCFYLILPCTRVYYQRPTPPAGAVHAPAGTSSDEWIRVLSVTRMPLELAYASTFHGLQGLTLPRIKLDLAKCWDPEQIYVGLSRVHSLKDVCIVGLPNWMKLYGNEEGDGPSPKRMLEYAMQTKRLEWEHSEIEEKLKRAKAIREFRNRSAHAAARKHAGGRTSHKRKKKKGASAASPPLPSKKARKAPDGDDQSSEEKRLLAAYGMA